MGVQCVLQFVDQLQMQDLRLAACPLQVKMEGLSAVRAILINSYSFCQFLSLSDRNLFLCHRLLLRHFIAFYPALLSVSCSPFLSVLSSVVMNTAVSLVYRIAFLADMNLAALQTF